MKQITKRRERDVHMPLKAASSCFSRKLFNIDEMTIGMKKDMES